MRTVRRIYIHMTPRPIREAVWWVRNMVLQAVADRLPEAPTMDYTHYWQWREARDDTATTHPGLVEICAEIIPDGARVLDVGCGTGDFLAKLQKRKAVEGVGIDVSEEAVALARKRGVCARADCWRTVFRGSGFTIPRSNFVTGPSATSKS